MQSCRQLSSDGLYAYRSAVEDIFGEDAIDFGQYVKPSTTDSPVTEDGPRDIPKPLQQPIMGDPDEDKIGTSFVERQNLTLRMQNRRYTRKTNGFSKKLLNHKHSVSLWYGYYNWVRPHGGLKGRTPAMAAGLAKEPYPLNWLCDLIDARATQPQRPHFYNTKNRTAEAARMAA